MTKILFNGELIDKSEAFIPVSNRGFRYGDGLFETMAVRDGHILYWDQHFERLTRGMRTLSLQLEGFQQEQIQNFLYHLLSDNEALKGDYSIRLQVWREEGGLFTPSENTFSWLAECRKLYKNDWSVVEKAGFSAKVFLYKSPLSNFKTLSSLNYILAGLEKEERGWDEIILTGINGNVSECLASNIFWVKREKVYTPSLNTGCVDGIRRKNIIACLREQGVEVEETFSSKEELKQADFVFECNANHLQIIKNIEEVSFLEYNAVIDKLSNKV